MRLAPLSWVPFRQRQLIEPGEQHATDRMRDLVRRAILACLCLADKPDPPWPFIGETAVDAILADDAQREIWRSHWHAKLDQLGVGDVAERPRSAAGFLSRADL